MWQQVLSNLTHLGPTSEMGREGGKGREKRGKERESFRERISTFSLNFPAIRPTVSDRARRKVLPCYKSYE